jgi:predicted nucleic acid-binding protein
VGLQPGDMNLVTEAAKEYKLDFDDAYQYASAGKFGLIVVSFDSDFDRTPRRKKSSSEIKSNPVRDGEEPKT